jgi:hypothetical protein
MGLFRALTASEQPLSAGQLASQCQAEEHLTARLLRCLRGFDAVKQQSGPRGEILYSPTRITEVFTSEMGEASARWHTGFTAPAWIKFPEQMKSVGYKSLTADTADSFAAAHGMPGKHVWEILGASEFAADGGVFMTGFNGQHQPWWDIYPVEERIVQGARKDGADTTTADDADAPPFMVDIGGYTGSQAIALQARYPHVRGAFAVLDLPDTLASAHATPPAAPVRLVPHDFFAPFPAAARGARLYYMRYISHNWGQAALVGLLRNVRAAMTPGYSRLVINDWVVPERSATAFMSVMDLIMMTLAGGEERTEGRFREAVGEAGLVVTGVWRPGDLVSEAVVECEVKVE